MAADLSPRELQRQVGEWQRREFRPNGELPNPLKDALKICEEAGEVAERAVKRTDPRRHDGVDWGARLKEELPDTVIACFSMAENEGFDLWGLIDARWGEVGARRFATGSDLV